MDTYESLFGKPEPPPPDPLTKPPGQVPYEVTVLFEKLALDVWRAGYTRYSAYAIVERIRWHFQIDMGRREFKLNCHWIPWMSRWFMRIHPECGKFFVTRAAMADGLIQGEIDD